MLSFIERISLLISLLLFSKHIGYVISKLHNNNNNNEGIIITTDQQEHYLLRRINNRHFQSNNGASRRRRLEKSCSANNNCIGLDGNCCPTNDNIYLECCYTNNSNNDDEILADEVPTTTTTTNDNSDEEVIADEVPGSLASLVTKNTVDSKCSSYPKCDGLTGHCCPTNDGSFLECCGNNDDNTSTENTKEEEVVPVPSPIEKSDNRKTTNSPTKQKIYETEDNIPIFNGKDFGSNVIMIDNTLSTTQIQGLFDDFYNKQVNDEMGTNRYSIFFQPGEYGSITEPLMLKIGYYTEVAGLGINPMDVIINGKIEVYNRCFEADPYSAGKFIPTSNGYGSLCFALNNFWRSLSNLSINIISINQDQCRSRAMFWAISQASSMRRVNIQGGEVSLMDYCTEPGYASGGYIADSRAGKIFNGSQQQFIARNLDISEWDGGIWNQVFLGVIGAPDDSTYPDPPYTTFETTPISREKPYLYIENGEYYVRVPSIAKNTKGTTWSNGQTTPGESFPISSFFVVNPSNTATQINRQVSAGKNLLFTPGVYDIDTTIFIRKAYTVVLGLGHATLTPSNGVITMQLTDKPGIIVAGLTFDAGIEQSDVLLQVGEPGSSGDNRGSQNPITLSDVYFRVGGPHIGKADINLEINSDNVLIDHTWVWRADHGIEDFDTSDGFEGDNIRWKTNIGRVGAVINGNDVTATGLFVEHYQQYNVIWNGNGGHVYFFQNELPYDPPTQDEWTTPDGTLGWAGYKVSDTVTSHEFWSGGVYSYNRNNPDIITANGFEAPNNPNVKLHKTYTRNLSGPGIIQSVINGVGQQVDDNNKGPEYVTSYP